MEKLRQLSHLEAQVAHFPQFALQAAPQASSLSLGTSRVPFPNFWTLQTSSKLVIHFCPEAKQQWCYATCLLILIFIFCHIATTGCLSLQICFSQNSDIMPPISSHWLFHFLPCCHCRLMINHQPHHIDCFIFLLCHHCRLIATAGSFSRSLDNNAMPPTSLHWLFFAVLAAQVDFSWAKTMMLLATAGSFFPANNNAAPPTSSHWLFYFQKLLMLIFIFLFTGWFLGKPQQWCLVTTAGWFFPEPNSLY